MIHYWTPHVERLNFHLEHQKNVVYGEYQPLDEIVENQTVKQRQFKAWFEVNKKYEEARSLTYAEFPKLAYDNESLKTDHETLVTQLIEESKHVYNSVMNEIDSNGGGLFFVYGYSGTDKTFVWKTLSSNIRNRCDIDFNVASSGIVSLFLPVVRTTRSKFDIPLSLNEDSTCNISQDNDLTELIISSKLIIWDEALMTHKHYFEDLELTMRNLLRFVISGSAEKTFGKNTVVLGGDFRQILPVIPKEPRPVVVEPLLILCTPGQIAKY
ncbi:PREDICTED: uncharacterized protein LOC109174325 [Ipomoea nil]|uniref:uncharacterized protein LOC109174325 n=1 Tax=Ipomoea nil TaxID=35883 RepID=UPI0009018B58|nr:PREDICTED: uncharacterized protein LOC109174325 [Ipomoea nil]